MKIFSRFWKVLIGGAATWVGYYAVAPQFGETALTGSAVVGVAIFAVGITVLAGAFD